MSLSEKDDTILSDSMESHPRSGIPDWQWKGTLAVLVLTTLING